MDQLVAEVTGAESIDGLLDAIGSLDAVSYVPTPVFVDDSGVLTGTTLVSIATSSGVIGYGHACALDDRGQVFCWGTNKLGQLGDGSQSDSTVPVRVEGAPWGDAKIVQLALGAEHSCALDAAGGVRCWGGAYSGQLGDGQFSDDPASGELAFSSTPVPIDLSGLPEPRFRYITASGYSTCAITTDDDVYCWGDESGGKFANGVRSIQDWENYRDHLQPSPVPAITAGAAQGKAIKTLDLGNVAGCAITLEGETLCWGLDTDQLGVGVDYSTIDDLFAYEGDIFDPAPVDMSSVPAGTVFTQVSVGDRHSCALSAEGEPFCWGAETNWEGRLAHDSASPRPIEMSEVPGGRFVQVSSGSGEFTNSACGVTPDGRAYCWGNGSLGQLGDGRIGPGVEALSPVPVDEPFRIEPASASSVDAISSSVVLGAPWASGQQGYGQVEPSIVYNGGSASGQVRNISWKDWGSGEAIGQGEALFVAGGAGTADAGWEPATVVAFDLGECQGLPSYNGIVWYFPSRGESADLDNYIDACTGTYVIEGIRQE